MRPRARTGVVHVLGSARRSSRTDEGRQCRTFPASRARKSCQQLRAEPRDLSVGRRSSYHSPPRVGTGVDRAQVTVPIWRHGAPTERPPDGCGAARVLRSLVPEWVWGDDVLNEVAPQGWDQSPLVACFHPSVVQVFEESVTTAPQRRGGPPDMETSRHLRTGSRSAA